MGRYAYFNTGFEYKFAFAIQPSSDILIFGGVYKAPNNVHWNKSDMELILSEIRSFERDFDFEPVIFDNYENTTNGTYKLQTKIYENNIDKIGSDVESFYKYRLGCVIYHQLLYNDELSSEYEN